MGAAEQRGPGRGFRPARPAGLVPEHLQHQSNCLQMAWPAAAPQARFAMKMAHELTARPIIPLRPPPPAPSSLSAQRRARLAAQLGQGGIAIIPTAPERPRNRDNDFAFRHDSYFYYLTGFTEPGAALVLAHDGQSTLFCQPKDPEREIWDGYRLGPAAAPAALGVDAAHPITEFDARLPRLLENSRCVWYPFGTHSGL